MAMLTGEYLMRRFCSGAASFQIW